MNLTSRYIAKHLKNVPPGTLEWIGLRPAHREPMIAVKEAWAEMHLGLKGDHRYSKTPGSGRQITLISQEQIEQIRIYSRQKKIWPEQLRRNLVVKDINLAILRHQHFQIGEAVFEGTSLCQPCSRMNATVGEGTFQAMFNLGGLCAKIVSSGTIRIGDPVILLK